MTRATPERDLQRASVRWLRTVLPGSIVAAVVNEQAGAAKTPEQRMRFGMARKASGVVSGFVDVVCLLQDARTVLVELKAPGGVVSENQQIVHAKARALGHTVILADSIESLRLGLHQAGIATREAAGAPMAEARVKFAKPKMPVDQIPW